MDKIIQPKPSTISQDEYNTLVSSKMYMSVLLSESDASNFNCMYYVIRINCNG